MNVGLCDLVVKTQNNRLVWIKDVEIEYGSSTCYS